MRDFYTISPMKSLPGHQKCNNFLNKQDYHLLDKFALFVTIWQKNNIAVCNEIETEQSPLINAQIKKYVYRGFLPTKTISMIMRILSQFHLLNISITQSTNLLHPNFNFEKRWRPKYEILLEVILACHIKCYSPSRPCHSFTYQILNQNLWKW